MRPDDPLAEKEFIKEEDLIGKPLILPERVSIQSEIANWFGKDFSKLQIDLQVNWMDKKSRSGLRISA